MYINKKTEGTALYRVIWTPKGTNEKQEILVWARNRLDASNQLIYRKMWGKQHNIEIVFCSQLG